MKTLIQIIVIVILLAIYGTVAVAIFHPHVSPAYRAFFITRTSTDYNTSHYNTTPEQGVIFNHAGLPGWVLTTHGLSVRDDWGRWTDANLASTAGLSFNQAFNGELCVDTTFRAVPWLVGEAIMLRMGNQQKPIKIASADPTEYRVQLDELRGADELDFVLPPKLPAVIERAPDIPDPRRLGINISSLRLVPGQCSGLPK